MMGAVEPSWEKAIEPLEQDTDGDKGPGLEFRLVFWELEIVERRFIHDGLRVERFMGSISSTIS